jgi:hypothetical protein
LNRLQEHIGSVLTVEKRYAIYYTVQVAALVEQHRKAAPATGTSSSDSTATPAAASTIAAPVSVRLQTFPRSLETFLVKDHALGEQNGIKKAQYPVSTTLLYCKYNRLKYCSTLELAEICAQIITITAPVCAAL